MPRYVILEHDWPEYHFDLFLDAGDALRAWKLPADFSPLILTTVEPNDLHRRHYLDYEGAISDGRGVALRWDFGEFVWLSADLLTPSAAEKESGDEVFHASFKGHQLKGIYEWRKTASGWTFGPVT